LESSYSIKYLAEKIDLINSGNTESRISQTLYNSKINLNPHQIQAALFAFKAPISKGVILCDEVGLGKTIEAGIVISQYWHERKRNILIISPASLLRQWSSELSDKFDLETIIIDSKTFHQMQKSGQINPLIQKNKISIMSINFASRVDEFIKKANFDLVVIDEAHKLRNVTNSSNIMSNKIKDAISSYKKLLLTATPIQNNLLELYGLSTIIDENIFGDKDFFKFKYISNFELNKEELQERLSRFVHRTLRKQVSKYINYPKRLTQTFNFSPSDDEVLLYDSITELIQSNPSFGTGKSQTTFISIVLRKLLSSSTKAVINTLQNIEARLRLTLQNKNKDDDFETIFENDEVLIEDEVLNISEDESSNDFDLKKIENELLLVRKCIKVAKEIKIDKKTERLLDAINYLFGTYINEGRSKKILIFTESRKTQDYLFDYLQTNNYINLLKFNGSNNEPDQNKILQEWLNIPENSIHHSNSKATNMRASIIEKFRNDAEIMIATEAGAEGLNLQFCSMVINYDLPWNPQRVEQRIGRSHRYGQKNDVIVINFLNTSNLIDQRIYDLLETKFHIFDEVFGSSDEILGRLDDEVNFDKKIFEIYRTCRSPKEINEAFEKLQDEFKYDIEKELKKTTDILVSNFDEQLQNRFDSLLYVTERNISQLQRDFSRICKHQLNNISHFVDDFTFEVKTDSPIISKGFYSLSKPVEKHILLRPNDSFGKLIIQNAKNSENTGNSISFNLTNHKFKVSEFEKLIGSKGLLSVSKLRIDSFESEEYLLLTGRLENGSFLDQESCEKLLTLLTNEIPVIYVDEKLKTLNDSDMKQSINSQIEKSKQANSTLIQDETKKINDWANDKISGIQLKVEILRERRKSLQKESDYSTNSEEKLRLEEEVSQISKNIKKLWLELATNEDLIETERKRLIEKLKMENMKNIENHRLFQVTFEIR